MEGESFQPSDKWILDIWYVQNMSFFLDLRIVLRTVKMALFGDQINVQAVQQARRDLGPGKLQMEMVPAE